MGKKRLRIAVATSSRSDFGLIRPTLRYLFQQDPDGVELLCLGRAAVLDSEYLRDGIGDVSIVRIGPDGNKESLTSSHETIMSLSQITARVSEWLSADDISRDWILIPGDRFEIFAATIASYYNNVPVAHLFAGDRSEGGHQDDSVRHAISRLAHQHFAVCEDSYRRLLAMGEEPWRVHNVGSPVVESVHEVVDGMEVNLGKLIETRRYNIICTYHPITTEPERAGEQFQAIIAAFDLLQSRLDAAVLFTPPNNENGSGAIQKLLAEQRNRPNRYVFADLGWKRYLQTVSQCDLVVGNSSSAMLEAPILGVPALDVGTRQRGRFSPSSVRHIEQYDVARIAAVMEEVLKDGRGDVQHPYGDGNASRQIFETLRALSSTKSKGQILRKRITY